MVDANNTRATSKKIKDSASSKNKNDDISVANALIPATPGINPTGSVASTTQAHSGSPLNVSQAPSGSPSIGTQALSGSPLNPSNNGNVMLKDTIPNDSRVNDTTYSLLVDTSESRRDRAPVASLLHLPKAKPAEAAANAEEEETEEDNSPDIATSSVMTERQNMWQRAIAAQDAGDTSLAEMLFNAIGRIGASQPLIPAQKAKANVFAVPTRTPSGAVIYQESAPVLPPSETPNGQTPEKFFLTEGDLVYAIGSVTNHNSVGFAPFLDENIRKLRSPLPLTIFNRKWQQRAMSYHLDRRHRSDDSSGEKEKSGGYKGFAFVQEWTQTYAQWTRNHRAFCKTLHDVYKIKKFSKLLATHKNNCDDITEEFGFMVAFRYDMEVRNNTFSHRITDEDVKNAIPDISQRKESVVEQCYNVSRNFGELEWEENLYAPGLSHCNHDPLTGYVKTSKVNNVQYSGYQNNAMIHNPISQGQWVTHSHNNYNNHGNTQHGYSNVGNYNGSRNISSYQNNGGIGNQNNGGNGNQNIGNNKRPRGGYRGGNYSDNFQGRNDGNQQGKKGNTNK
ncbi:hypothetical protein PGTUg99_014793 [Puccinia graminis f. sp. tritici]|uniref:Uncharacterized protein n=2 Tax=Puccinia graminis f. sp. tritici TaxID=56615 RepID=H6QQJ0_PUCGT|nr:uncharacterized protein PGTG_21197 [Puccinia graminis f. sp. tritici CRL 75-36-700-3]EHS62690.1 hypothetical protein PGTG_21197 [Puccinia graminis f. sp. tritici CRL 75-36-700-3]KAA1112317.1 hypothetical protein PGTUg99_014793 [Puccinia graminis f. sp. tritici]